MIFDIKMPSEGRDPYFIDYVKVHNIIHDRNNGDLLKQVVLFSETDLEKVSVGRYKINWDNTGLQAGDYIVSWQWQPVKDKSMYSYEKFYLNNENPNNKKITRRDKYDILMDLYLPSTYKNKLFDEDLTPEVISSLNKAAGEGFLMLEDMADDIINLLDANKAHQSVLPLLANLFNLKLKSNDVMRWRHQIKNAMSLFKKKGTYEGLKEALSQAGIKLKKLTMLWQVVSSYTWTDHWQIEDEGSLIFPLTKKPLENLELFVNNTKVPNNLVQFMELDPGEHVLAWIGHNQPEKIHLFSGDILRITYKHKKVKDQELDNYIRRLPLARKDNWNVRLLEEDDPMFDVIIPVRHPFHDPVVYGQVQSTFLYSEKVYNMDSYNGSLRDSTDPADIGDNFLDACNYCRSSSFNVDVDIENVSNERIAEAREIIEEYSPFHAILHSINASGLVTDYILPPIERIKLKIKHKNKEEVVFDQEPTVDNISVKEKITCIVKKRDGTSEKREIC